MCAMNYSANNSGSQPMDALGELRHRLRQDLNNDKIAKCDLNRIFNEDWWPMTFLNQYNLDADIAYAILLESLKWRANFGIHHISLLELKPLLEKGLAYLHGKDYNDKTILWINMNQHKAGEKNVEKLIVYWLERHTTERRAAPITVFFNMANCRLQNMDLDLVKFILHAFKYHFPCCLASILVFESPSMLNATWKLIRSWMDPDVQHFLQHVTRASVQNFVPPQYLPVSMGGEDQFVFKMDEVARCIPNSQPVNDQQQPVENGRPDLNAFVVKRTVTFESEGEGARSAPVTTPQRSSSVQKRNGGVPSVLRPLADSRINSPPSECVTNKFLTICPREELSMSKIDGETDSVDVVVLKNESSRNVIYKIKITSPEKFRVRPSTGVIAPGTTEIVRVYLQNEYKHSINKEKFLLMAMETDNKTSEDFSNLWKSAEENCKVEHKLRCRLAEGNEATSPTTTFPPANANTIKADSDASLQRQIKDLSRRHNFLIFCVLLLILLQVFSLLYQRSYYTTLLVSHMRKECPPCEPVHVEPLDVDAEL